MRRTKRELEKDIERGKYVLNPKFRESEAEAEDTRAAVMEVCSLHGSVRTCGGLDEFQGYYPEEYGKVVPEAGTWIVVQHPPQGTEYTVPPFSIWYAVPWQMDGGEIKGRNIHRVRIQTPCGDLGLFPREYALVNDIKTYIGREKDGVLFHRLSGEGMLPTETLFYMQSRGISRPDACMMLLDQIADPTFGWFEIAPPYGAHFGEEWPTPRQCPFATPASAWQEEEKAA